MALLHHASYLSEVSGLVATVTNVKTSVRAVAGPPTPESALPGGWQDSLGLPGMRGSSELRSETPSAALGHALTSSCPGAQWPSICLQFRRRGFNHTRDSYHKGVLDWQAADHVSQRSEHGLVTEQQQQQRSLRFLSCTQREWESLRGDSILGTLKALRCELFSIPAGASFLRGDLPLRLHSLPGGLLLESFRLEAPQSLMRLVS